MQPHNNNATTPISYQPTNNFEDDHISIATNDHSINNPQVPKNLLKLYHDIETHYILEDYCLPISDSFQNVLDGCKYKRDCLITKNKVITKAPKIESLSPTVFGTVPANKKNNYYYHDIRLIKCFNSCCKNTTTKSPKVFHHSCFMHMMKINSDESMKIFEFNSTSDNVLKQIDDSMNVLSMKESLINDSTNLIFPVCGKRCYNCVTYVKSNNTGNSEYATSQNWTDDGSDNKRSSVQVLIDWLTTEPNCSRYHGGLDNDGRTSSNRKDTYHYLIRDLIKKENGMYLHNIIWCILFYI